ncbi:Cadherin domain [Popillia japonica]|uniref:Cadherin domain n=1 Tax=Popillia japonica TaxID=7064 RepID=A0AAW1KP32_POPJA
MESWKAILTFVLTSILPHEISNQGVTDNRCYLENGASSESFFVSEDLPIGSFIGQIRVHGDPRPGGTIALYLRETDSPIIITSGTKNLTLRSRLDKEGIDGPSSVLINLICERLHTLDPVFVIPINVRVSDANDNAPVFVNAPYELNISEVTVVGTRVLQGVHAVDADQQGPFSSIRYDILPGRHADYFEFENELEGTALDYETLKDFDVKIRAQDHGEPPKSTDTTLTVHVVDADDQNPKFLDGGYTALVPDSALRDEAVHVVDADDQNPKFLDGGYTALVPDSALRDEALIVRPRDIRAVDQDLGINAPVFYTFNGIGGDYLIVRPRDIRAVDQDLGINAPVFYTFNGIGGDYSLFRLNRENAKVFLRRDLTDTDLIHPATLVIRATQQDNSDRYALATLTVSRMITKGFKFLKRVFYINVAENQPVGTVVATFYNNRPGQALRYFVSEEGLLKVFAINPRGEISVKKRLDYEEKSEYYFKIFATDGITNDSAVVNITVEDVNEWEPRFRHSHYEFYVTDETRQHQTGRGDRLERVGQLLRHRTGRLASFTILATDSGSPPRRASVPVTVHFPNFPDADGITKDKTGGAPLILAGLGGILLVLAFVVVLLVAYICRAKRRNPIREQLPSLPLSSEKSPTSSTSAPADKISNPVFADRMRSPTASAMGGVPNDVAKSRIPSPKVHPAPQPPIWANSSLANRVKKLSWGDDKTDSDSTDNMNNIDTPSRATESTNLTVYF